jgi:hypothetical protein
MTNITFDLITFRSYTFLMKNRPSATAWAKARGLTALLLLVLAGAGVEVAGAGERIVYDSRGKAHRVPDINYKPPVKVDGVIPRALDSKKPLELINPFAGPEYGWGRGMVSWNREEGKPKGFILLDCRFW